MGSHFGTTGMWYKDGVFYELEDTHVNFFLNYYEILGFNSDEKEALCVANGLAPDATHCYEQLQNCVIDGSNKCFGPSLTVKDVKGWGENLNSMGWGKQISDFTAGSTHQQNYQYINFESDS